MNLLLSNPAGLWALLAVPVLLLIHFLQEKSRRVRTSTLFLLERVAPESVAGARFERLRQSVPLWLQLLAVLVLTWMLCAPRWIREDSRQTMVVVLDSSVSMSAFREPTRLLLEDRLKKWAGGAVRTDWHLLETDARKRTLYAGGDWRGVLQAFDGWNPMMSTHDHDDALVLARGLVKGAGMVIFVTDHEAHVPSDVALLSAGGPLENTGFTGAEVNRSGSGGMHWQAMVRNHGEQNTARAWWLERLAPEGQWVRSEQRELVLQPGQTVVLSGELPPDETQAVLVLGGDRFIWDDRLPLQLPVERVLKVNMALGGRAGAVLGKMVQALPHVVTGQGDEALTLSELGSVTTGPAIQVVGNEHAATRLDGAFAVAEDHPLTRGLNWMGLLTNRPQTLTLTTADEPLLWKEDRVLALLRTVATADGRQHRRLILNWDLVASNADRHPALLVMLHRFVESLRLESQAPWAGNFECGQRIPAAGTGRLSLRVNGTEQPYQGRAPEQPGFFELWREDETWLRGAVRFADTREADFSAAAPVDTAEQRRWESALRQTEADPWTPLWMLTLLGCLLGAWGWKSRRRVPNPNRPPH